jgi:hypothetical protein
MKCQHSPDLEYSCATTLYWRGIGCNRHKLNLFCLFGIRGEFVIDAADSRVHVG